MFFLKKKSLHDFFFFYSMQLFSADAMVFSKRFWHFFWTRKSEKTCLKSCSYLAQPLFSHSPGQTTAHSPELIFHIMKSRDQTSVVLSVLCSINTFDVLFFQAIDLSFEEISFRSMIDSRVHNHKKINLCPMS